MILPWEWDCGVGRRNSIASGNKQFIGTHGGPRGAKWLHGAGGIRGVSQRIGVQLHCKGKASPMLDFGDTDVFFGAISP